MKLKNFIRVFVCIVLVCILLFNSSPLRAQALEPVSTAIGIGLVACLLLGTAGIVFNPTSNAQIEAIGNSMQTYLYQWGTSAEKLDDVDEFFGGLTLYDGSPDDDGDDDTPHERQFKILDAVKTGLAAWLVAIASGSFQIEEEGEVAPDSSLYYNSNLFPNIENVPHYSKTGPYHIIVEYPYGSTTYLVLSNYQYSVSDGHLKECKIDSPKCYQYVLADNSWVFLSSSNGYAFSNYKIDGDANSVDSLQVLWTNFDLCDGSANVLFPSSDPADSLTTVVEPSIYVGDIPEGIKDGSITADNLELPDLIDYSCLAGADAGLVSGVTGLLQNVSNGTTTYDDYLTMLQPVPDPDPAPETEPDEPIIPAPDLDNAPLSDLDVNVFFDTLADIITAPFKWIWEKLDTKLDTLKPLEFDFDRLTEIITAPFHWIWEKIETVILPAIRSIPDAISDLGTSLQTLGNSIIDKIAEVGAQTKAAIESLVVPDEDYLSDKIAALCEEFAFADSIVRTTQQLGNMLVGVTTEPPVIYIDLGSTRGSYDIGGVVPFLDLRWYAEYKPTVDAIISAFLWVCFIWRMFLKLPGIINGAAGDFVLIQSRREDYFNDR